MRPGTEPAGSRRRAAGLQQGQTAHLARPASPCSLGPMLSPSPSSPPWAAGTELGPLLPLGVPAAQGHLKCPFISSSGTDSPITQLRSQIFSSVVWFCLTSFNLIVSCSARRQQNSPWGCRWLEPRTFPWARCRDVPTPGQVVCLGCSCARAKASAVKAPCFLPPPDSWSLGAVTTALEGQNAEPYKFSQTHGKPA